VKGFMGMEKSTVRENPTGRASVTTAPAPSQWQEVTTDDLRAATEKQLFAWMAERGKRGYDAWAEFHWRYASTFHHLVSRLPSMDASEVENLVQDTMVQAWHSAHTYQASAEARDSFDHTLAWLGTIARNLYRAMRRRQKLRLESHDQAGQSADEAASPPDRKRQLSQMHHAIRAAESNMLNFLESPVETMSERRARFQEALVALSERERDVRILRPREPEPTSPRECDR
jgi:RNA polymerase sigma factor (sigma-70 family)